MTTIRFENVAKDYGDACILEQINLSLGDHEFLGVVGPSGAGKSTFLKLLSSQEQPSRGRILLDGKPIAAEPTPDRGVVFQRYSVFDHRTVLGNVMVGPQWMRSRFFGRLFGEKRRQLEAEAMQLLGSVGLAAAVASYPHQLSGGMQQRLAIAQAFIMKPKVLLLDEPFGALDPRTRRAMHELIRGLWEETGMTVVMVTHDLSEAFSLATRVIAIDKLRHDPHAPERYGASICTDLDIRPRIVRDSHRRERELRLAA